MQNSPTHRGGGTPNNSYPYYDRNGYYVHQQQIEPQNWHEPVQLGGGGGGGGGGSTGTGGSVRADSPTINSQLQSYAPVTTPGTSTNQYTTPSLNCKIPSGSGGGGGSGSGSGGSGGGNTPTGASGAGSSGPPQPPSPTAVQKQEPTTHHQYQGYNQCPISQSSQPIYNNNIPPPPPSAGGAAPPGGPPGAGHQQIHNNYALTPDPTVSGGPGGQPSPSQGSGSGGGSGGGGGGGQGSQGSGAQGSNTSQAQLPSPLYPWMRSQFGKKFIIYMYFLI